MRFLFKLLPFSSFSTAVLLLGLLGCSAPLLGTSSGPKTYVSDQGQPSIVCLGDSLTAGDGASGDQSYPAWLQRQLTSNGFRYRVVNAGVSGNRVADGLKRLQEDVLSYHPKVVIVELGSNDPGNTPAQTWEFQLDTLVARIQASGTTVILGGLDEPGMADIYRAVAAQNNAPLVWFTAGLFNRPGLWGNAHHPNGAGYRVVMQNFWKALAPLLVRV